MNNGFENDNLNENAQQDIGNDDINSDTNGAQERTAAAPPQNAGGAGRSRSEIVNTDDDPAVTPKEKFSFKNFTITGMFAQIKKFWTDMTPKWKKITVGAALGTVVFAVFLAVLINRASNPMVPIYTGLEASDVRAMVGVLDELAIKVDSDIDRGIIYVKQKQENAAYRELTTRGYPKNGKGLVYTEPVAGNTLFQTQDEIEDLNRRRREEKLDAVITSFEGISWAAVTITPAERTNKLIVRNPEPAKVNAVIHTEPNFELSYESIQGIETLLLNSVAGLTKANISINDASGALLNAENSTSRYNTLSELKKEYERESEYYLEQSLLREFEKKYGKGNIGFNVNLQFDFDPIIEETMNYIGPNVDQDTEKQSGITSSSEWERNFYSQDPDVTGGAAGTDLNIDDPNYYEWSDDAAQGVYGDDIHVYNQYLVDSVQRQIQKETPRVLTCTVSVMINGEIEEDENDSLVNYIATATPVMELANRNLAEDSYADVDLYRSYITVFASPWYEEPVPPPAEPPFNLLEWLIANFTPTQLLIGAGILLLFIILLIVIIIIVRRSSKKEALRAAAAEEREAVMVDSEGTPIAVDEFGRTIAKYAAAEEILPGPIKPNENREQLLKKQIRMFTDQNPEISAQLIRTLLKGDELTNG